MNAVWKRFAVIFILCLCKGLVPASDGSWLIAEGRREALREQRNDHYFGNVIRGQTSVPQQLNGY